MRTCQPPTTISQRKPASLSPLATSQPHQSNPNLFIKQVGTRGAGNFLPCARILQGEMFKKCNIFIHGRQESPDCAPTRTTASMMAISRQAISPFTTKDSKLSDSMPFEAIQCLTGKPNKDAIPSTPTASRASQSPQPFPHYAAKQPHHDIATSRNSQSALRVISESLHLDSRPTSLSGCRPRREAATVTRPRGLRSSALHFQHPMNLRGRQ